MKFIPRNYDLFADVFDDMFDSTFTKGLSSTMKTDIHSKDGNYLLNIELPGYTKEDIDINLSNGYLNISAKHEYSEEEKDDNGYIIHEERSFGSCSRSFYVGDDVKSEDIKAKFDNGILKLIVPNDKPHQIETNNRIMIDWYIPRFII